MVKFAVIGCGRISEIHLKAIQQAKDAQLVAVCDVIEQKAKEKAMQYNVPYYLDMVEMIEKEKPQVVIIGTPSGMHAQHTVICANHGVNVLCEKSLDISKESIDTMIKVCEDNNVKLGGIFQRRTYTAALETKKAIDKGLIGKLVLGDGYFKYSRKQEYYDSDTWRGTWALDGGGALMNQCIHGIDMLLMLCGDIESVTAKCGTLTRNIEVEDTAIVLVKFKNGAFGVIEGTTSLADGEDTIFDICGDKGGISFGDNKFLKWNTTDCSAAPTVEDSLGGKNCGWVGASEGHKLIVQDMAECIMYDREPIIPPQQARKAVDVILAIYESAKTNKEVFIYD